MNPAPRLSVIVVSFRGKELLIACLESLRKYPAPVSTEIIVVDNRSGDGTPGAVRDACPDVRVIVNDANIGFAAANAVGLGASRGQLVLFLNNDAEVLPGTLDALIGALDDDPLAGAVGCRVVGTDGVLQQSRGLDDSIATEAVQRLLGTLVARRCRPALGVLERWHSRAGEADWVTGACLLARREVLEATGGFDTGFFMYFEDHDLCRRIRQAGWRVLFTPAATVLHHGGAGASRAGRRIPLEYRSSQLRYYRKHHGAAQLLLLRGYLALKTVAALAKGRLGRQGPGDRFRRAFLLLLLRRVLGSR